MFKRISLAAMALSSIAVAIASYRFLILGITPLDYPGMGVHIDHDRLAFIIHIVASPIALAAGCFQFMPRLRAKHTALHRVTGRIYASAILVGGLGALAMAPNSNGGPVSVIGFSMLGILWISSTMLAVRYAMAKRFDLHRIWMIRSFAMTFAAVTLRLELQPLMYWARLDYPHAIQITAWLSWVLNLLIVEWWIIKRPAPARIKAMA